VTPSEDTVLDIALELHEEVVDAHEPENPSPEVDDMSTTTSCCEPTVGVATLLNAERVAVALVGVALWPGAVHVAPAGQQPTTPL